MRGHRHERCDKGAALVPGQKRGIHHGIYPGYDGNRPAADPKADDKAPEAAGCGSRDIQDAGRGLFKRRCDRTSDPFK
jgi:hypothetical protein